MIEELAIQTKTLFDSTWVRESNPFFSFNSSTSSSLEPKQICTKTKAVWCDVSAVAFENWLKQNFQRCKNKEYTQTDKEKENKGARVREKQRDRLREREKARETQRNKERHRDRAIEVENWEREKERQRDREK